MGIRERSESRDGYAVRVLAVHTSEGFDKPVVDDAAALRDAGWWVGSSHAIADNDPGSLLTPAEGCVPYDRASWTLLSGNRWSENIELIAQAGWTRAQWLERPKLLENCARWLADRSQARDIPLVKLTPQQYRAGQSGVIGHHDHTVGYSDGTHWDPGPGFPWDVVIDRARQIQNGEDDVQLTDPIPNANPETRGKAPTTTVENLLQDAQANAYYAARNTALLAALDRDLRADLAAKGRTIDALVKLVAEQNGLVLDDVRRVVAEEVAKGVQVDVTVQPGGSGA